MEHQPSAQLFDRSRIAVRIAGGPAGLLSGNTGLARVFIIAACLTLIPLLGCLYLNNRAIVTRLHQKMEIP